MRLIKGFYGPYKGVKSIKFFPNSFKQPFDYYTYCVDEYMLMKPIARIPFIGEFWYVVDDDVLHMEKRKGVQKLIDLFNIAFLKEVFDNKLLFNIKIIEVASGTLIADRSVDNIETLFTLAYEEMVGHIMYFTVLSPRGTLIAKNLHTLYKVFRAGYRYKKTEDIQSHIFTRKNKSLYYYFNDKCMKIKKG
jgi:hypothetical protein